MVSYSHALSHDFGLSHTSCRPPILQTYHAPWRSNRPNCCHRNRSPRVICLIFQGCCPFVTVPSRCFQPHGLLWSGSCGEGRVSPVVIAPITGESRRAAALSLRSLSSLSSLCKRSITSMWKAIAPAGLRSRRRGSMAGTPCNVEAGSGAAGGDGCDATG